MGSVVISNTSFSECGGLRALELGESCLGGSCLILPKRILGGLGKGVPALVDCLVRHRGETPTRLKNWTQYYSVPRFQDILSRRGPVGVPGHRQNAWEQPAESGRHRDVGLSG